jgi:glycerol-3-phosphate acyltransferase PlsY
MLAIYPKMFLIIAVVFLVIVLLTQYVSLGSIIIMILFVVQVLWFGQQGVFGLTGNALYEFYGIAIFLALLAIWRHRANIVRLVKGTENKTNLLKSGKKS